MAFEVNTYESKVLGLKIFENSISSDLRGTIWTSFNSDNQYYQLPSDLIFKHDKFSFSKKNVLRGIHGDSKSWKLVTCVFGEIMQVVVDLRENSKMYKRYEIFKLDGVSPVSLLVPPGMGNAYLVKSNSAVYHYKLAYEGDYIDASEQFSVKWDDPSINIEWPILDPILSERDN
tara:strand:+ start:2079 stop:2600 length:522 start_codon:yes stop_codon:yes gene_type:complete